jgi:hypothetical protein
VGDIDTAAVDSRKATNDEVGTMRWTVTLDGDDVTLVIATIISAVGISLALM